jgi:hypothetical protein
VRPPAPFCEFCGRPITDPEREWVFIDSDPPRHSICGYCFDHGICFWRDDLGRLHVNYQQ